MTLFGLAWPVERIDLSETLCILEAVEGQRKLDRRTRLWATVKTCRRPPKRQEFHTSQYTRTLTTLVLPTGAMVHAVGRDHQGSPSRLNYRVCDLVAASAILS